MLPGMKKILLVLVFFALVSDAQAQTLVQDKVDLELAQVVQVVTSAVQQVPGTEIETTAQTLKVQLLEGPRRGDTITIENDYRPEGIGDKLYVRHAIDGLDGHESYVANEPYRLSTLVWLLVLFLVVLVAFGGKQGVRGFVTLCGSLVLILYVLLPGILHGYPPLWLSLGVAALIVMLGSYLTHGLNRATHAAVLGMLVTLIVTGLLAYTVVSSGRLSGYTSEETTYLNLNTQGSIDFVGLLLGSLLIGFLGVLYDAAISQAIAVEELVRAAAHYTRRELFARGLRIGREHIGALVNTLAIAYAGASLPLLLLLVQTSTQGPWVTLNREFFATEIVRILVGSIGIILAVPVTTIIAVYLLHGRKANPAEHREIAHTHRH